MYKKILVPLDGSKLAECALPHVENMVKAGAVGEVTFSMWSMFISRDAPRFPASLT